MPHSDIFVLKIIFVLLFILFVQHNFLYYCILVLKITIVLILVLSELTLTRKSRRSYKLDCGAVPYDRATADSADAAQVDRVNVASSFRQAQWLQIVKSAKRSEIARPNFNQVFRASLSICPSISLSTVSMAYFGRVFEKNQLPAVGNGPRNFKSFYRENAAWNSVISSLVISSCQAPPKRRVRPS
jgi:hypothetical protein